VSETSPNSGGSQVMGRAIRNHIALILISVLVVAALAGALAAKGSSSYTAIAGVLVRPLDGNALSPAAMSSSQQVTIGMTTEAALVNSAPVVAQANKTLETKLQTKVVPGSAQVSGSVPPNTQIVDVQFKASTARAARIGAQTFALAFLRFRAAQSTINHSLQIATLQKRIKTVQAKLAKAAVTGNSKTTQLLTGELQQLRSTVFKINNAAGSPGIVYAPARRPVAKAGLSPLLLALVGALVGLVIGVALAVWRERSDDRLRGSALSSAAGVPILARISAARQGDVTVGTSPQESPLREAFREARAGLLAVAPPPQAITVAPVDGDAEADLVGVNLAQTLARSGYRVTLVSAGTDSELEAVLGIQPAPGLSELLTRRADLARVAVMVDGVAVLPRGGAIDNQPDLLDGQGFSQLIDQLQRSADYVIVVANPVSAPGGLGVALATDGVVLTGVDGVTTHAELESAVNRGRALDVTVIGLVLVPKAHRGMFSRRSRPSPVRVSSDQDVVDQPGKAGASDPESSMVSPPR
jgi:Mrp family chromosome partitioning ATPase/capsular polysaccharide biosynthesis protein